MNLFDMFSDSTDSVTFEIDSENAYNHVMDKFGSVIEWDGDAMVAPRKYWSAIQEICYAAGGKCEEYNTDAIGEGEVAQFPKKHPYELLTDCPKCGGPLQGGKDEKGRLKLCMPCMTIYRAPNQQGVTGGGAISEDSIRPKLVSALKELGFNGPFKLGQLPKWMKALGDGRFGEDTSIMIGGNDPNYDPWVAKGYDYGYAYGMESGYQTGLSAQEVVNRVKADAKPEGVAEDATRSEAQASYMQGQCMILAVAINQYNPQRYPVGYIWEYNVQGIPDMQLDDDEWQDLTPEEQQAVSNDPDRRSLVHAFVYDQVTKEYIDARGRHRDLPNLWGKGVTRFEKFPGSARELIDITAHGEWDDAAEEVSFKRGRAAFDSVSGPAGVKKALDYAIKYLGVVGPESAGAEGVAEGSLNEFAVDGFGDSGDHRSKLLASVGRLFDAGNKVDWQVPGQMGHVTRVQDDGVTMKKWKMPHSRMSFFLPMRDDSRDKQYTIKMVAPKHYAVVSAEQGVAEGSLNEFAPGDSGDDRTYEYEVYQCNPNDEFDWIGGPLYQSDMMDKVHGFAYEMWKKHPDKAFMIWQERSQGSRGGYGIKDDDQGVAEGSELPVQQHKSPYEGAEVGEYTTMFKASPNSAQRFAKHIISKGGKARIVKRGQDYYVYHNIPMSKEDWRKSEQQGVAEADLDRRGFLKGAGAAALGAMGGNAMAKGGGGGGGHGGGGGRASSGGHASSGRASSGGARASTAPHATFRPGTPFVPHGTAGSPRGDGSVANDADKQEYIKFLSSYADAIRAGKMTPEMRKWLTSHPDVIADLKRGKYGLTMGQLNTDLVDLEQRKNPHLMREEGVEEGKLGTAAALAGAIALGGAMGYKHSTKDPNVEPTIKTKYERNAEVGAKLKKKISGDQKNEGVAEGRSCNMSTEGEVCPVHGLQGCDTIMQEALAPLELAQVLHQAMEEKYPQATSQFGHEAIGDAIMDAAEDAHNTNSMSDVDMIIDDIIEQLGGQVDRDLDEGDEESESPSRSYTDPELEKTMNFAKTHYAGYPDKEQAFMKYVQRSIKHSKEEDVGQSNEIEQLRMDVAQLKRKAGLGETRMYYNVVGTSANSLRKEFGMRKDANGWYLKEDSGRRCILEAHRAFGTPLLKEYDLAAYTGSTQVQGSDNVISPIGSKRTKS